MWMSLARSSIAQPLGERRGDVLERGDLDLDRTAEHDFGRADGGRVARIGKRNAEPLIRRPVGKDRGLAQETSRERRRVRGGGDQLGQTHPRQPVKARHLVGEVVGRQIRQLPQLSQAQFRVILALSCGAQA
jgi:hypothetical protein